MSPEWWTLSWILKQKLVFREPSVILSFIGSFQQHFPRIVHGIAAIGEEPIMFSSFVLLLSVYACAVQCAQRFHGSYPTHRRASTSSRTLPIEVHNKATAFHQLALYYREQSVMFQLLGKYLKEYEAGLPSDRRQVAVRDAVFRDAELVSDPVTPAPCEISHRVHCSLAFFVLQLWTPVTWDHGTDFDVL